jgi:uncharacterized protein YkwD
VFALFGTLDVAMLRLLILTLFFVGGFSQSALAQEAKPNDIEKRAFEQTNLVRIKNGLPPFTWDADICRMARIHSESMSRLHYFSHVTPEGLRLGDRARAAGILQFSVLGENIGYTQGYDDPATFMVDQWMQSAKHRANILSPEFRAMAIGSFAGPDGSIYLTQTFITR